MPKEQEIVCRPFHEMIVASIREADTDDEMNLLGCLIMRTEILQNHKAIAKTWKEECGRFSSVDFDPKFENEVLDSIEKQQKAVEQTKS